MSTFSANPAAKAAEATARPPRLLEIYDMFFDVVPAATPDLLREAHRLRYQVYCVENRFEPPSANPGGIEIDDYDTRAVHSLLIHRASARVAGTVRLILPDAADPPGLPSFALARALAATSESDLPRASAAEISRFVISKDFRRRIDDGLLPAVADIDLARAPGDARRRVLPSMTLGLMRAVVEMSLANGITHWCAIADFPLLRLLKRLGIGFVSVGPRVEHRGLRQPVCSEVGALLDAVRARRPEVWDVITNEGRLVPPGR